MATTKQCSKCNKNSNACYCTGCKAYFCMKDFKDHRDQLNNEINGVFEQCVELQSKVITVGQYDDCQSPVLTEIDEWEKVTTEKVKKVAEQARLQAASILTKKRKEIPTEFKILTEEVVHRKDSEDFVEHDLTRLKKKIRQLDENVKELAYPPSIVLNTKQSDQINWTRLIYVEGNFTPAVTDEQPPAVKAAGLFHILSFLDFIAS